MNTTILGCGAYGLAIATTLLENNTNITIWNKFQHEIDNTKDNYPTITFTTDLKKSITNTDLIIIAIPVNFIESTITELKNYYNNQDILITSKGIDIKNNKFAYEIVKDILNIDNIGVISGGSFAIDMQNKNPLGLTLATNTTSIQTKVNHCLKTSYTNIQTTNDILGVSICGSIKNVMAIGYGILDGSNYPESTKFLFLTKAIYEIEYLINKLNGNKSTIMSYAGLDDIMMTCTSSKSRNYTLGNLIGKNTNTEDINTYKNTTTIEGLGTSKSIYNLAIKNNIDLPISKTIYNILYNNQNYTTLIDCLNDKN